MGFRTVVVLRNDQAHDWEKDPSLGKKIWEAADGRGRSLEYGEVIEMCHADSQTLMVMNGYSGVPAVDSFWQRGEGRVELEMKMLKLLAAKHGYGLRKKAVKK